jgi:hypothetical protein
VSQDDLRRRAALLEATVREILRIADAAETCGTCVPPADAFDAEHGRAWRDIVRKARRLLASP